MADTPSDRSSILAALAGGITGIGLGVVAGVWWGRRVPGHIYRDGDDWYVDEPVLRELQRRMLWSGGPEQDGYYFLLRGRGSIKVVPTRRILPEQSGPAYAVELWLARDQALEFVMLDLVAHRVGKLKVLRYTPRQVPGRMVQGPGIGPPETPAGETPSGADE